LPAVETVKGAGRRKVNWVSGGIAVGRPRVTSTPATAVAAPAAAPIPAPGRHLRRRQWQRPTRRSSRWLRHHALARRRLNSRTVASEWALARRRPGPARSALLPARTPP